jgi:hypothetical protein
MQATQWQPSGESMGEIRRKLATVIRAGLVPIAHYGTPEWENGRMTALADSHGAASAPVLAALSWRMQEKMDWQRRGAAMFVFSGAAWVADKRVDFTGECVRDLATGCFFEFELITMGLNFK